MAKHQTHHPKRTGSPVVMIGAVLIRSTRNNVSMPMVATRITQRAPVQVRTRYEGRHLIVESPEVTSDELHSHIIRIGKREGGVFESTRTEAVAVAS